MNPTVAPTRRIPAPAKPGPPPRAPKKRPRGPLALLGRFVRFLFLLGVGYLVVCTLLLGAYRFVDPPGTTVQLQRVFGALLDGDAPKWRYDPIDEGEMAPAIRHAVVASEDSRFYTHGGIDWIELKNAREAAERSGRAPRGASTITQQLVKNLFLTTHRSWVRKGMEVPLTFLAEALLPKERILTLYLNSVEWGIGVYGIEEAARYYYDTSAANLSRNQAARLAAILPAPLERSPGNMGGTARRIQRRMSQMGW